MNDIETLIAPLLRKICGYCVYKNNGYEVPQDVVLSEIRSELNAISQRSSLNPVLQQQYAAIEKPLIFFIDYTIKEGGFSYSGSYKELARNFNELSGDDKFFDLLKQAEEAQDDKEVIRIFYILMGLGFDGFYKRKRPELLDIMQKTATHFDKSLDFNISKITPDLDLSKIDTGSELKWYQKPRNWIIASVTVLLLCFIANLAALSTSVSGFSDSIDEASRASISSRNSGGIGVSDNQNDFSTELEQAVKADQENRTFGTNDE
ncbi:MAG TPA: hypothetical protein DCL74_00160 [Succinivibrionaceae bacterium]|nr:hypothetical protein [Succinivibrionaceae bacterium]